MLSFVRGSGEAVLDVFISLGSCRVLHRKPRNALSCKLHGCSFALGPVAVDTSRTCPFCLFAWQGNRLFNYELLPTGAAGHCNETHAPNGKLHGCSLYLIAFLDDKLAG